jgi:hypothetical protein
MQLEENKLPNNEQQADVQRKEWVKPTITLVEVEAGSTGSKFDGSGYAS